MKDKWLVMFCIYWNYARLNSKMTFFLNFTKFRFGSSVVIEGQEAGDVERVHVVARRTNYKRSRTSRQTTPCKFLNKSSVSARLLQNKY